MPDIVRTKRVFHWLTTPTYGLTIMPDAAALRPPMMVKPQSKSQKSAQPVSLGGFTTLTVLLVGLAGSGAVGLARSRYIACLGPVLT